MILNFSAYIISSYENKLWASRNSCQIREKITGYKYKLCILTLMFRNDYFIK